MDYVLTISPEFYDPSLEFDELMSLRAELLDLARRKFEAQLGGTARDVIAAWLACHWDGGVPSPMWDEFDLTPAQLRWRKAQIDALAVYYFGDEANARTTPIGRYGDTFESAWLHILPRNVHRFQGKCDWTEAFLSRLKELNFELPSEHAQFFSESEWRGTRGLHPTFVADRLAYFRWPTRRSPTSVDQTIYTELEAELLRSSSGASGKVDGGRRPTANSMAVRSDRRLQGCPITRSHHSK